MLPGQQGGSSRPRERELLGEQMSKNSRVVLALGALVALTAFLLNCGSSSSRPAGVLYALSQGENKVGSYAVNLDSGKLSLINANAKTCPAAPCGFPEAIVLDAGGTVAFVLDQGDPANNVAPAILPYTVNSDGSLSEPGTPTTLTVGDMSRAIARDEAGTFLLVANQGSDTVSLFSMSSGSTSLSLVGTTDVGQLPAAVAIDPNDNFFYVVNQTDDTVGEYDLATRQQKGGSPYTTGSVPSAVLAVRTTPVGGTGGLFVYVANSGNGSGANSVSIFSVCLVENADCSTQDKNDAKMLPVGSPISVGLSPVAMAVDPTNNFLYIVNQGSNTVSAFRINPTTGALSALNPATVTTGTRPVALSIHPNGKFLFVSNNGSSNISAFSLDPTSGKLAAIQTITSSAQPSGVAAK